MRFKRFILSINMVLLLTVTACSGNGGNTSNKENTINNQNATKEENANSDDNIANADDANNKEDANNEDKSGEKASKRDILLRNDNTNTERNQLLTEDIKYFKEELPICHKNLFSKISKEEFNDRTDQLIEKIDQLNNNQVFVELNKIIASVGDAHTTVNYWDGYTYPLQFWILDGDAYVVNADTKLKGMMYSKVLKINGADIHTVLEQLTSLISYENESWVFAMLPNYLQSPVYMYGLGIIQDEQQAVFTVQKGKKVKEYTVTALDYGETANLVNHKADDVLINKFEKYYNYKYMTEQKTLYFQYNVCADMEDLSFNEFNQGMFKAVEGKKLNKIIVDLRNNSGGNSEVLNPFTDQLKEYVKKHPEVKVYLLVGRNTMSSGMFAIYRVKEAAPKAVSIGEPTGGALDCYGDIKTFNLPNSQIPINYSTKYFEFSKSFSYKNSGADTFLPDVLFQPSIEDYIKGTDVVLEHVLAQ